MDNVDLLESQANIVKLLFSIGVPIIVTLTGAVVYLYKSKEKQNESIKSDAVENVKILEGILHSFRTLTTDLSKVENNINKSTSRIDAIITQLNSLKDHIKEINNKLK